MCRPSMAKSQETLRVSLVVFVVVHCREVFMGPSACRRALTWWCGGCGVLPFLWTSVDLGHRTRQRLGQCCATYDDQPTWHPHSRSHTAAVPHETGPAPNRHIATDVRGVDSRRERHCRRMRPIDASGPARSRKDPSMPSSQRCAGVASDKGAQIKTTTGET